MVPGFEPERGVLEQGYTYGERILKQRSGGGRGYIRGLGAEAIHLPKCKLINILIRTVARFLILALCKVSDPEITNNGWE